MDRIQRFGLIAAVAALALLVPTRAASSTTPPPVIEVLVTLTDLPPAVVNVSVPDQPAPTITIPEQPAPIVNVTVPEREVTVTPPPPQVITEQVEVVREVEVDRIVEVPVEVIVVCNPAVQPQRTAAVLTDGVVTNFMAGNPGQQFTDFIESNADFVEVTCLPEQPQTGWTWDGNAFAPPN